MAEEIADVKPDATEADNIKVESFGWEQAVEVLRGERPVRRTCWESTEQISRMVQDGKLAEGTIQLRRRDATGALDYYVPSADDMRAEDWVEAV